MAVRKKQSPRGASPRRAPYAQDSELLPRLLRAAFQHDGRPEKERLADIKTVLDAPEDKHRANEAEASLAQTLLKQRATRQKGTDAKHEAARKAYMQIRAALKRDVAAQWGWCVEERRKDSDWRLPAPLKSQWNRVSAPLVEQNVKADTLSRRYYKMLDIACGRKRARHPYEQD